jgi:hypothetical protein
MLTVGSVRREFRSGLQSSQDDRDEAIDCGLC